MNYRMILSLLGDVLLVIGAFLLLPCIVAVIYGEPELWVLLATAAGSGLLGGLFILLRPKRRRELHARDGFVMVALSWILISLIGAVPFTVSGAIPRADKCRLNSPRHPHREPAMRIQTMAK